MASSTPRLLGIYILSTLFLTIIHALTTSSPTSTTNTFPTLSIRATPLNNSTYFPSKVETPSTSTLNDAPSIIYVTSTPHGGTVNQTVFRTVGAYGNSTSSSSSGSGVKSTPTRPAVLTNVGGTSASSSSTPGLQNEANARLAVNIMYCSVLMFALLVGEYGLVWEMLCGKKVL
ncbi:hypothetical protein EJ08DRAFT_702547 [Tothia fuscella]|uniref:Uncharacterized protein n=1 Tax=Tothia fuscella TaxID=1048955 RepID=A0A9P4NG85_9PEZI|nr:hypothetical protein EJ08DRAFT_702547 [Tothia fuscella]